MLSNDVTPSFPIIGITKHAIMMYRCTPKIVCLFDLVLCQGKQLSYVLSLSYPNHTLPGQALLPRGSLPVLCAHSYAINLQLLYLIQRKRKTCGRYIFMTPKIKIGSGGSLCIFGLTTFPMFQIQMLF